MIFFGTLSLVVQTVSNFKAGKNRLCPFKKTGTFNILLKSLLHNQPISDPEFAKGIAKELGLCISRSGIDDRQKIIITHRLSGFG